MIWRPPRSTLFPYTTLSVVAVSLDRKSTRLNSSHTIISYAVFCLKKIADHLDHLAVLDDVLTVADPRRKAKILLHQKNLNSFFLKRSHHASHLFLPNGAPPLG